MSFFSELKRRNIFKVAGAYLVISWLLVESSGTIAPLLRLPEMTQNMVLYAIMIGFPIVLAVSWMFEVTDDGIKPTKEVDLEASITSQTGKKLEYFIIIGLLAAVILLIIDRGQPVVMEDPDTLTPPDASRTIAVLPFVNMSSDPEQEFFSDGITEEILNALVRIDGLKVTARTSAFAYKGQSPDLRVVGRALGVANILEGSVRKAGNQLRITAQLVNTADGTHIWSEVYDRELTDVFAIQDEIARAIATALTLSLGVDEGESLVTNRMGDMEAYDMYLRANALVKARGRGLVEAIQLYDAVIAREPDYAPAWAGLSQAWIVISTYVEEYNSPMENAAALGRAGVAAERAVYLDSENVMALGALANWYRDNMDWARAESLFLRAIGLDPENAMVLEDYAEFLEHTGRIRDMLEVSVQMYALEPTVAIILITHANALRKSRQNEASLAVYKEARRADPEFPLSHVFGLTNLFSEGRTAEARAYIAESVAMGYDYAPDVALQIEWMLEPDPEDIPEMSLSAASFGALIASILENADMYFEWREQGFVWHNNYAWGTFDPIHSYAYADPRFKALLERSNLTQYYWDTGNWPDVCRPITVDDFVCGVEE